MTPNLTTTEPIFTRAGAFGVDDEGYVVNGQGQYLQVFPANPDGSVTSTSLSAASRLQIPQSFGTPTATTQVDFAINLPAESGELVDANFDASNPLTYNQSTSLTVFDSLGTSHVAEVYFVRTSAPLNQWQTHLFVDGVEAFPPANGAGTERQLNFTNSGTIDTTGNTSITYSNILLGNGSQPLNLSIGFDNTTQFSADFSLSGIDQNGSTTGRLTSMDVTGTGVIRANYSNGEELALGKIAIAWAATPESGVVLTGEAGTGTFGDIQGGALETANVDLTAELVKLITAQRNFQANAKAIETNNSITQAIIQI